VPEEAGDIPYQPSDLLWFSLGRLALKVVENAQERIEESSLLETLGATHSQVEGFFPTSSLARS